MKVLIVEDEKPAVEKLKSFIEYYDSEIEILDIKSTVAQSIEWLRANQGVADLIFLDIQLPDGISFDIFNEVQVLTPVIFTTAYNQYAIQAFQLNSIDYLLKPFDYNSFYKSLEKFKSLKENILGKKERIQYQELSELISNLNKEDFKNRFMIKVGDHIKSLTTDKITLFWAEGRDVSVFTKKGRNYLVDYKLEELEQILNPKEFFRISRSFIVHINAITDAVILSSSRLKVLTDPPFEKELIVSRDKVNEFKYWFSGDKE
jgi:DNA-binding LytR/AlgR family response regulator